MSDERNLWPIWIKASAAAYFNASIDPEILFILEEETLPNPPADIPRVELRLDGPTICDYTSGQTEIHVDFNILLITKRNDSDLYDHDKLLGKVIAAMATSINVIKTTESGAYFGCLQRQDEVITTRWGELNRAPELIQSTVEGSYKITL